MRREPRDPANDLKERLQAKFILAECYDAVRLLEEAWKVYSKKRLMGRAQQTNLPMEGGDRLE